MKKARLAVCAFGFTIAAALASTVLADGLIGVRKKFVAKSYNWESVRRVAIFPIQNAIETEIGTDGKPKWSPPNQFPSDSVLRPLLSEMIRRIKYLDSTIVVLVSDPLTFEMPDPALIRIAGKATSADAVIMLRVTKIDNERATPETPGVQHQGRTLPPIPGKPASTSVRMNFTIHEVRNAGLIWQFEVDGKGTRGGLGETTTESSPPGPEGVIKDLVLAAGLVLPF